jgi:glycosyltransferase involved in cell wall biosynthesis
VLVTSPADLPPGTTPVRIRRRIGGRFARAEHDFLLPREIARFRPQVFHSPGLHPPAKCAAPWVQTLHDVIPLTFDAPEFKRDRQAWLRWRERIREADGIVAVSQHVAAEGARVLDLPGSRFTVALHGVSPAFRPSETREVGPDPYLLFVAEFDPRKGYAEAFAAISELASRGYPHRLKVAGRVAPWIAAEIQALLAAVTASDRVDLLGFVPHSELPGLYRGASAALMTNRDEGFGLPALEAMACGTPLVAFANTSLTEVIAGGGLLVPDGDVPGVVDGLARVIDDRAFALELSQRGLRRAQDFTWARSAAVHAAMFSQVAA